jgi:hypothetical protein
LAKPFQDPTQQDKPSRSGSAQLLTASPYRRQLQQAKEKKTVAETKKAAAKRLFGKAQVIQEESQRRLF